MRYLLLTMMAACLQAEYVKIEQSYGGMECASCADFVKNKLAKNAGVAAVEVDTKKGVVVVKLKETNNVKPLQIRDFVQQSGYTPKETKVVAHGKLVMNRGIITLHLNEKDSIILIDPQFLAIQLATQQLEITGVMTKADMPDKSKIDVLEIKAAKPLKK